VEPASKRQPTVKPELPIYVDSELDEAGLNAAEFRVLAHIARRGNCFAKLKTMAKSCRLNRETVQKCLRRLEILGLISKEKRPGHPNVYWINPKSQWASNRPPPSGKEGLPGTKGYLAESAVSQPLDSAKGVAETGGYKVHTIQGLPNKALIRDALSAVTESEFWGRLRAIIPNPENHHFGILMKQNPEKFRRVLEDTEERLRQLPTVLNPGGLFTDTWKRFK